MPKRFFGKRIEVDVEGEILRPVSFRMDGKLHVIKEVVAAWPDYGFGNASQKRHRWWQRHHRNYFHVRTAEDETFEIYFDRGVSLRNSKYRKWYITRRL